ncbi:uncharacterized protein LOC142579513 [Dermacentor variabilis]|uniref:uncharacterized protein LOC142579513 n=1 Tax=Dermacentor variabilis TaxID=34621 RepID=UPI003F5C6391
MEGDFERLQPDAHDDPALDRVAVAADHALTLANVSEADVGFYVCHDNEEPPTRYRMEYLLDVAVPRQTEPHTGDEQQYNKYLEELQEGYGSAEHHRADDGAKLQVCAASPIRHLAAAVRVSGLRSNRILPGAMRVSGPGVAVTWFHNGSKLRPTWSRVSLSAASQEVLFKPLKERDAGIYECTVMGVKMGHLELHVRKAKEIRVLGMTDASWFTLVTVLANFCAYLAVLSANWNQHYKRLEIQDYLATKRAERQQVS